MSTALDSLDARADAAEIAAHAALLVSRLDESANSTVRASWVLAAASRYLARSIIDVSVDFKEYVAAAAVEPGEFAAALETLRSKGRFRSYLWEWIGRGRPRLTQLPLPAEPELLEERAQALSTAALAIEEEDSHSFVERVRRKSSSAVGRLRSLYNSWTGSRGTTSYYDKDSSPD